MQNDRQFGRGRSRFARGALRPAAVAAAEQLERRALLSAADLVTGTVFADYDGDGVRSAGEPGFAKANVYFDGNDNGRFEAYEAKTVTDSLGGYRLLAVPEGAGTVRLDGTSAADATSFWHRTTAPGDPIVVGGGSPAVQAVADVGMAPNAGTLVGSVFYDWDGDGEWGLAERAVRFNQSTVRLERVGNVRTSITVGPDAFGRFKFTNVAPDVYQLTYTLPPATGEQLKSWTTPVFTVPPPAVPPGQTAAVGFRVPDFGLPLPATPSVSGTVYADDNGDGTRGAAEAGVGSGIVFLDLDGSLSPDDQWTTPDGAGRFAFLDVAPGDYTVHYRVQDWNWAQTGPGSDAGVTVTVAPGQPVGGVAFGAQDRSPAAVVAGVVYDDRNRNGTQDAGEPGVPDVFVLADADGDGATDTTGEGGTEFYTNTAADGSYRLTGVRPNAYTLVTNPPQWWHPSGPATVAVTVPDAGPRQVRVDRGIYYYQPTGRITGSVYQEWDRNGVMDGAEQPGDGWVYLDLDNDRQHGQRDPMVHTDVAGRYRFDNLVTGDYVVRPLEGYESNPAGVAVHVEDGQATEAGPLLYIDPYTRDYPGGRGIAGTVFEDLDADGVRDAGEPGVRGLKVQVRWGDPPVYTVAWSMSKSDGSFDLQNLGNGPRVLGVDLPAGWTQTSPRDGNLRYVPDATYGEQQTGVTIGVTRQTVQTGTITGRVFNDLNRDQVMQPGEEPPRDWFVLFLDDDGDGVHDADETRVVPGLDDGGYFTIPNVAVGDCRLEVEPSGAYWERSVPPGGLPLVRVEAGQTVTVDRGIVPRGLVGGTVFDDLDGDGFQDGSGNPPPPPAATAAASLAKAAVITSAITGTGVESGLDGRTVYLDKNDNKAFDPGEPAAVTDAQGKYVLYGMEANRYVVRQVVPAGWAQTYPASNAGYTVEVGNGAWATNRAFGTRRPPAPPPPPAAGTVAGMVFNDLNGDGVRQPAEPGIAGRKVWADRNKDGVVNVGDKVAYTTSSGTYTIAGLAKGVSYRVREVSAAGYRRTTAAYLDLTLGTVGVANKVFGETKNVLVSGVVYNDANASRTRQTTEAGLSGWRVYIDRDNDGLFDADETSTLTGTGGTFAFKQLPAGTYVVRVQVQAGWKRTTPTNGSVVLKLAQAQSGTASFGVKR